MQRFFVEAQAIQEPKVKLEGEQARQIARVLRMRPGNHILALDDSGWEYELVLDEVTDRLVVGILYEKRPADREPLTRLTLYQSLLKRENFEWVLQKCTEIGAAGFIPTLCERTVRQDALGKPERWAKIVREAAEQSERGRLPTLAKPLRFAEALAQAAQYNLALIAWEDERTMGLGQALAEFAGRAAPLRLALFIGPEGGFSAQEVELARLQGVRPVSLGRRILRSETAAVAAAAIVLHRFE